MANREYSHFLSCNHIAVQGNVARPSIRNDQLAQFAGDAPADQRVCSQVIDGRLDGCDRIDTRLRMQVAQTLKSAFELLQ